MHEAFPIEDLAVSAIGRKYAELRIVKPRADRVMEKSIRQYGQMLPTICVRSGLGYEMIDGFKRLRACQRLGRTTLSARIREEMPERVCKAAVVQLNQTSMSISDLEEAMVIQSLYRKDGMNQPEIAVLFGRDKSWVSRRLSLIERLSEEVRKNIMLGLVSVVTGRELARLPRGNQDEALAAVVKHWLSTRDVAKLTSHLLSRPSWEYAVILKNPWEVLDLESKPSSFDLKTRLLSMRKSCRAVSDIASTCGRQEAERQSVLIEGAIAEALTAVENLRGLIRANEQGVKQC